MRYKDLKNPMSISELSQMYGVSPTRMRTIVSRSEFSRFDLGKLNIKSKSKMTSAYCYDVTSEFDKLMKSFVRVTHSRSKK